MRRLVLTLGLVAAVLAGLFPPWQVDMGLVGKYGLAGTGHHFLFVRHGVWRIDLGGLLVSWVVIALLTAAALVILDNVERLGGRK